MTNLKNIEPPCGVGAEVYVIPHEIYIKRDIRNGHRENNKVSHHKVECVNFFKKSWYILCEQKPEEKRGLLLFGNGYKEIWFLSYDEADQKLKELERCYYE